MKVYRFREGVANRGNWISTKTMTISHIRAQNEPFVRGNLKDAVLHGTGNSSRDDQLNDDEQEDISVRAHLMSLSPACKRCKKKESLWPTQTV